MSDDSDSGSDYVSGEDDDLLDMDVLSSSQQSRAPSPPPVAGPGAEPQPQPEPEPALSPLPEAEADDEDSFCPASSSQQSDDRDEEYCARCFESQLQLVGAAAPACRAQVVWARPARGGQTDSSTTVVARQWRPALLLQRRQLDSIAGPLLAVSLWPVLPGQTIVAWPSQPTWVWSGFAVDTRPMEPGERADGKCEADFARWIKARKAPVYSEAWKYGMLRHVLPRVRALWDSLPAVAPSGRSSSEAEAAPASSDDEEEEEESSGEEEEESSGDEEQPPAPQFAPDRPRRGRKLPVRGQELRAGDRIEFFEPGRNSSANTVREATILGVRKSREIPLNLSSGHKLLRGTRVAKVVGSSKTHMDKLSLFSLVTSGSMGAENDRLRGAKAALAQVAADNPEMAGLLVRPGRRGRGAGGSGSAGKAEEEEEDDDDDFEDATPVKKKAKKAKKAKKQESPAATQPRAVRESPTRLRRKREREAAHNAALGVATPARRTRAAGSGKFSFTAAE